MLRSAREARGVDLATAERDLRIRARHLAALEEGRYDDLPGDVYAKGFLRSYAAHLGLEPDTMVALYRLETGRARSVPVVARGRSTRPLTHQPFVITTAVVAAAVLTVLVGALIAYLAYQLITFARTPELRITDPPGYVLAHAGRTIQLRGLTAPDARVSVSGLAENPTVQADESGAFTLTLRLAPGSNLVTVTALDPVTLRSAPAVTRRIEVTGPRDGRESPQP
jgi:cytoskeletal protein RodZ